MIRLEEEQSVLRHSQKWLIIVNSYLYYTSHQLPFYLIICDGYSQSLQSQRIPCPILASEALDFMWRADTDIHTGNNQTNRQKDPHSKHAGNTQKHEKKFKTFSWKFRYEPFLGFQWRPSVMKTLVISRFCFTDIRVTCVSIAQINTNLKEHITRRQSEEMRQSREIL